MRTLDDHKEHKCWVWLESLKMATLCTVVDARSRLLIFTRSVIFLCARPPAQLVFSLQADVRCEGLYTERGLLGLFHTHTHTDMTKSISHLHIYTHTHTKTQGRDILNALFFALPRLPVRLVMVG